MSARISAIAAMAENRVIGKDNTLLWHIPDDLKLFKQRTMGKPVIMGRKTFESVLSFLGKPMPGRTSIVVSRSGYHYDGVTVCPDIETALVEAQRTEREEIFIGGGGQIYQQALPYTDRIYLTTVHKEYEGDSVFPVLNQDDWEEISCKHFADNDPSYSIRILDRV